MFNSKNILTVAMCEMEEKSKYLNDAIPVLQATSTSKRLSLTVVVIESQICTRIFLKSLIVVIISVFVKQEYEW